MCNHGGVNFSQGRASCLPAPCCRVVMGSAGSGSQQGVGLGSPVTVLAPLQAAQRSLDVQHKVLAACPEPAQRLSLPRSLPQALVPLSCFAAAPLAGGMEGCPLPAAMEGSWCVCCLTVSSCCSGGAAACLGPSHRAKTSPIGSSCPPRTAQQRRVSLALLAQAKYSVQPWPPHGGEGGVELLARYRSCTEWEVGSGGLG